MRYMLDTCTFLYLANDHDLLSRSVAEILHDPENVLCISAETGRELIVGFNNRKFYSKKWKTSSEMIRSIEDVFGIKVLPIDKKVIDMYSHLELNMAQDHKDPSDHIIISHAITARIPLISSDTRFPFYRAQGLELIENKK